MYNTSTNPDTSTAETASAQADVPRPGAIILAGGRGERLSPDKGCLLVGDKPIVTRVLESAGALTEHVLVVGSAPLPAGLTVPVVADEGPDPGPVRGLATGLRALDTTHAFLLAWDMPFLQPALLEHMIGLVGSYDAVVPLVGTRPQPLCALYSRSCLGKMASCCLPAAPARPGGKRGPSMNYLLEHLNVRWVEEAELTAFGDSERLFFNVNTLEDLARAREMAQS